MRAGLGACARLGLGVSRAAFRAGGCRAPPRRHHHPGLRAGRRADGAAALDHDAHRPDPGLATDHAGGRTQPIPDQCAARPAPTRQRRAGPRGLGRHHAVADGARALDRHQRQAGGPGRLRRAARQAPGGPRVQPVLWRRDALVQQDRAGPLAGARRHGARGIAGVGSSQVTGPESGRQDDLRRGRPASGSDCHQHPAGGLGYDARQLFCHPEPRRVGRHAPKLDHILLPAARKSGGAARAGARVPEPDGVRRGRHPAATAVRAE
ncbi:hypothetical protein D3C73_1135880 [compost metagenome]